MQLRLATQKKTITPKKSNLQSVLAAQGRKGREGMSPFHYTRPVTVCADTGIHKKKMGFRQCIKTDYLTC